MNNVVVVDLQRVKTHPLYGKKFRSNKRIKAQKGKFDVEISDVVNISSVRPKSKGVHFKIDSPEKK